MRENKLRPKEEAQSLIQGQSGRMKTEEAVKREHNNALVSEKLFKDYTKKKNAIKDDSENTKKRLFEHATHQIAFRTLNSFKSLSYLKGKADWLPSFKETEAILETQSKRPIEIIANLEKELKQLENVGIDLLADSIFKEFVQTRAKHDAKMAMIAKIERKILSMIEKTKRQKQAIEAQRALNQEKEAQFSDFGTPMGSPKLQNGPKMAKIKEKEELIANLRKQTIMEAQLEEALSPVHKVSMKKKSNFNDRFFADVLSKSFNGKAKSEVDSFGIGWAIETQKTKRRKRRKSNRRVEKDSE